eukprot:TRINITY_DN8834_c0_g1_i1.p1 TRINITY_DN8834_c0_g1~~TRINITY_DN8834_c0_g1_i1.p1  ORF type:complete len:225 (-),score=67.73 TRINITY_DN8834_c0_g1_i1:144-818(-)
MASSGDLKELTFTVLYYEGQGLGELPRNLIRVGGLNLKNEFVDDDSLKALKPQLAFGQVPRLTVTNKNGDKVFEVVQSRAIVHYLANLVKYYGSSFEEAALVDQFYEGVRDANEGISRAWWGDNRDKDTAAYLASGKLNDSLSRYENFLSKSTSGFLVGNSPSFADIALFTFIEDYEILNKSEIDPKYENLRKLKEKVANLPGIKENLADPNRLKSFYAMPEIA